MNKQVQLSAIGQQQLTNTAPDNYKDRLIKTIPGEVVAAYMACNTAIT